MKKLLLVVFVFMLLATITQAKELPELSIAIERAIAEKTLPFANDRVKQMCEEWTGCLGWANKQQKQKNHFQIIDAEIERFIAKFAYDTDVWGHRFHIETLENGQKRSYMFEQKPNLVFLPPIQTRKFPGHPIQGQLSQHAKYKIEDHVTSEMMNRWTVLGRYWYRATKVVETQYIKQFDADGNALWARSIYITLVTRYAPPLEHKDNYLLRAYQTRKDGPYTYTKWEKINYMPRFPLFSSK